MNLAEAQTEALAPAPARVVIIDDHELLSQSLAASLRGAGLAVTLVPPTTEHDVLEAVEAAAPDVVLLDLQLGGEIENGAHLVEPLRTLVDCVVIMTGVSDRIAWAEALEAGAREIVSKREPFDRVLDQVVAVAAGESKLAATEREALLAELRDHRARETARREPFERLTVREREVLQDLVDGLAPDAIAENACISIATVRSHVKSILAKLGVNSQLAAAAMARRAGWTWDAARPEI